MLRPGLQPCDHRAVGLNYSKILSLRRESIALSAWSSGYSCSLRILVQHISFKQPDWHVWTLKYVSWISQYLCPIVTHPHIPSAFDSIQAPSLTHSWIEQIANNVNTAEKPYSQEPILKALGERYLKIPLQFKLSIWIGQRELFAHYFLIYDINIWHMVSVENILLF